MSRPSWHSLQLGSTVVGVRTQHGVVLAVEKRVTSSLLVNLYYKQEQCDIAFSTIISLVLVPLKWTI